MTLVWVGDRFNRASNRGPCAHCGKDVREFYPWWTEHPSKPDSRPLHMDCAPIYFHWPNAVDTKAAKG